MKRFERRRVERLRRGALLVGLSFALGALIDTALTWRLHEFDLGAGETAAAIRAPDPAGSERTRPTPGKTRTRGESALHTSEESAAGSIPATPDVPASAAVATAGVVTHGTEIDLLKDRRLEMPVDGIKPSALLDTFNDGRAFGRPHEAIDIMAKKGTEVHAVEDGTVAKLFTSIAGGLTIYQFDPAGKFSYYYAHLDSYAPGVREGLPVRRGQTLGYVGSTGNASEEAPHLHFAIFRLTPERKWWQGEAINPYPVLK